MKKEQSSYSQILRATSIFGSSQVVNILLGIIRTKVIALLLGVVGVGLIGVYQSVVDMIRSIAGLGFEMGAVKDIAQSADNEQSKTIAIFNRLFLFAATLSAILCIVFSIPISRWAFDDSVHALPIALLSVVVFFTTLTLGRNSFLQGLRKISFLAKATIAQSVVGLAFVVPVYCIWGVDGIVGAFIVNSVIVFFCANYFYRQLKIKQAMPSSQEVYDKAVHTFRLGIYILLGSIASGISMFLIRIYLMNEINEYAVGIFQSAWSLTAVFTGLILGATGADYFPRLCAIEKEKDQLKKLVNEQLFIVLVISAPIVIGILLFSKLILSIFYSSEFWEAQHVLQWQLLGAFLKIAATPLAMILLAKHKGLCYFISEVIFFGVYLLVSYLLLPQYGVEATGFGYLAAYVIYLIGITIMAKSVSSFGWSRSALVGMTIYLFLLAGAFALTRIGVSYSSGYKIALLASTIGFSYYMLTRVLSLAEFKNWFNPK